MSLATEAPPTFRTVAELLKRLGNVPPERVRLHPTPGSATERDLLQPEGRLCELVEGTLVEKTMGFVESMLTVELLLTLAGFVKRNRLGVVSTTDGMFLLFPGLVRLPDIAFVSWDRLPGQRAPKASILNLAPDLAVEVLSRGNTKKEIKRKLVEYFDAGVRLVWLIDPKSRSVVVHTSPTRKTRLDEGQSLEGGDVLPGFSLPLAELFECLDRGRDE